MYYVERYHDELNWRKVPFIEHRTKAYCDGYVDAMDSMYPSNPYRIVKIEKDGTTKVVRTTNGRSCVHLN